MQRDQSREGSYNIMLTDSDDSDHLDPQESLPGEQRRAKVSKEDNTDGGNLKEECKRESKEERETHTVKKEKTKRKKERDGERRKDKVKHKRTKERDGERRKDADKHEITEDSKIHAVKKDNNSTGMTDRDKHPQEGKKAKDEDRRTDKRKHEGKQDDEIYTARKKKRKHERLEEDRDVYKEKHNKKEVRDRSKKRQHKHKEERKEKGDRDRSKEKDEHLHQSKEDRDETKHGSMDMDKDKHKERKRDDKAKPLDGKVREEKGDVFASPLRVKYEPDNEPCHLAKRATKRKQDDCDNAVKPLKAKKLEQEDFVEKKATSKIKVGESGKVTKWTFLEHKGPVFTPEYEPLPDKVMFYYDGEHMKLSPAAEEVATFYARMLDKVCATKDIFKENFFKDWQKEMTAEERDKIKYLAKCDFSRMSDHFKAKAKDRKVALKEESWEEKQKNKEEIERLQQKYGFCTIDKQKERVYNFRTEPPGLFKGLRDHPKMGMLKHRIKPEDCTINCSADSKFPKPPPGKHWKDVCHNNKATWLVSWVDNINGSIKYISPIPSSRVKGEKDCQPIIKAKGEEDCQPIIKDDDTRKEKKRRHKHDGKDTSTKERYRKHESKDKHRKHESKDKQRHKKEKHRQHKKDKSKRRDRERRHRSSHAHSDSQAGGITLHSTVAV